jgi:tRNA (mo5U34)-methyltransferase
MNIESIHSNRRLVNREELEQRILELGPWFHNLDLCGIKTAPNHFLGDYPTMKWKNFAHAIPANLNGKSVLDIGCNAGFYSIEMKKRGAGRVLGIDSDTDFLAQAELAADVHDLNIEFRKLSVYDVAQIGERFDIVLFMGVLYHLRHPLLALDLIHEHVANDLMVFQSMLRGSEDVELLQENYDFSEREIFNRATFPKMHFVEKKYSDDITNWWIPNRACVEAMLRSSGFEILNQPEEEVFVCHCIQLSTSDKAVYSTRGGHHG